MTRIVLGLLVFVEFCQTSIWAFDKVLPRIALGFLSFCKILVNSCQSNIGLLEIVAKIAFGLYKIGAKITFGLCKMGVKIAFGLCKIGAKLSFGLCKICAKLSFGLYE